MTASDGEALAVEALATIRADIDSARSKAERALQQATQADHPKAASLAERALGLVAQQEGDLTESVAHLRRSIEIAERGGLWECAASARMSLCGTLAIKGAWGPALREADRAAAVLDGQEHARVLVQRATVLWLWGHLDDRSIAEYDHALPVLEECRDTHWLRRLHLNRGLLLFQRGELDRAESDLREAERLAIHDGQHRAVAHARQSLGLVASRRGNVPEALAWFDKADQYFRARNEVDATLECDRCEALISARLLDEARHHAQLALNRFLREGRDVYAATAYLRLAEAALAQGDLTTARSAADTAARSFSDHDQSRRARLAQLISLQATFLSGDRSANLLHSTREVAADLERHDFRVQAIEARLLGAQVAIDLGDVAAARDELARARRARWRGPVPVRVRAWHAEALVRLAEGNRRGAQSALQAGMRVVDEHRMVLGASDLRARAAGFASDLAVTGLRLAVQDGSPGRVLTWAERWRAGARWLDPPRPPADRKLAAHLGELRSVVARIERANLEGRSAIRLRSRQAEIEELVKSRARTARGLLAAITEPIPAIDAMVDDLGESALVELVQLDHEVLAVTARDGELGLVRLGELAEVQAELDHLLFAFRRLSRGRGKSASLASAGSAASAAARRLEHHLLDPLSDAIQDRPIVMVPTGSLHAVPWSALPSLRDRAVTVAPSLAAWQRAARRPDPPPGHAAFVAGPDLEHAASEIRTLARGYPNARRLTGRRATCAATCELLDGAALAHVAAHGHFRTDNPLFSSISLADGPLTVYDLERLRRAPERVVLAACETGLSAVESGDQLMGLAAALLALGTCTLIASVFPVPDEATRSLMVEVHRRLRGGVAPVEALAGAQAGARTETERVVSAAFVCFGSGR